MTPRGVTPQAGATTTRRSAKLAVQRPDTSAEVDGLADGGQALWDGVTAAHELDPAQRVQLLEICRAKDRLDKLDRLVRRDTDEWGRVNGYALTVEDPLAQANATANLMKHLFGALRLPDKVTGKRPQRRGPRGAHRPPVPAAPRSARERLRGLT